MADDIRRRLACDRCHSQKLRCPRRTGEKTCDRCAKARTSCIFSPFRQKKSQPDDAPECSSVVTSHAPFTIFQNEIPDDTVGHSSKRKRINSQPEVLDSDPSLSYGFAADAFEHLGNDSMSVDWPLESLSLGPDFNANYSFGDLPPDFDAFVPNSPECQQQANYAAPQPSRREPSPPLQLSNLFMDDSMQAPRFKSRDVHVQKNGWDSYTKTSSPESTSHIVRQLSDLSVRLFEHAELMPPQSIHDPTPDKENPAVVNGKNYSRYCVEDLFQLTQELIDLYPCFLNALFGPQLSHASTPLSMTGSSSVSDETDSPPLDQRSKGGTIQDSTLASLKTTHDHSSILLLLSCHLRLIGVYEQMFKHMKVCMKQKGIAKTTAQAELKLVAPVLQIGAYKPPPSTAGSMQMLLFVTLCSQLSSYATDLAAEMQERNGGKTPSHDPAALSRAAAEDVKSRAKNMSDELNKVRTEMVKSGLLA